MINNECALKVITLLRVCAVLGAKPAVSQDVLVQVFDLAIKALEQESCEDCISRKAELDGLASIAKAKAKSDAQKALMGRVMFFTEQLPSVTPRPTGKWISRWYGDKHFHVCSECSEEFSYDAETGIDITNYNICPNCGARMIESEDKE